MTVATRKFNPGFLTEDELVASFCVRTHEFESIIETLRGCTGNSNQHQIVIGPRGSGKTTLLLRVAVEIHRDSELSQSFLPIRFAEESYEVSTAGEFWLEALSQLAQQAPLGVDGPDLNRTCNELRSTRDDQLLGERCLGALMDYSDRAKKRLVLLVENLNMLFRDLVDSEAGWTLRHTLQTEPRIVLLASATSRFAEIDNPDNALYDLLRDHSLKPLATSECVVLWETLSGEHTSEERVRSLEILTGGSARLLAILAHFGAGKSLGELMEQLLDLIDDHTEYFKNHIEFLPPLERRVYLALAGLWKPATTQEVAERARIDTNKCSALLNRLTERGAVRPAGGTARRKQFYLTERLYNIYYLMRRHSGPERIVRALLQFMASYYSAPDFLTITREYLDQKMPPGNEPRPAERITRAFLTELPDFLDLRSQGSDSDSADGAALLRTRVLLSRVSDHLLSGADVDAPLSWCHDHALAFAGTGTQARWLARASSLNLKGILLIGQGSMAEAIGTFDAVLADAETHPDLSFAFAVVQALRHKGKALEGTGRPEDALATYTELDGSFGRSSDEMVRKEVSAALLDKGTLLMRQEREQDALKTFESLIDRFSDDEDRAIASRVASALQMKALSLLKRERFEEALKPNDEALERLRHLGRPENDQQVLAATLLRGFALESLGRTGEARKSYNGILNRLARDEARFDAAMQATVGLELAALELRCQDYGAAADAASAVLSLDGAPAESRCRALLARSQAMLFTDPQISEDDLVLALEELPALPRLPKEVHGSLTEAAVELGPKRLLALIDSSPSAELLLPFATALKADLGQAPRVAREVEEVAKDIRQDLAEARGKRGGAKKAAEPEGPS